MSESSFTRYQPSVMNLSHNPNCVIRTDGHLRSWCANTAFVVQGSKPIKSFITKCFK